MSYDVVRNTYQQVEATTPTNLHLVVMLYEGAIRFLSEAKTCIRNRDLPGKVLALDRALAILGELQATLKMDEGGEIAQSLDRLYTYMTERIVDASMRLDTAPLDEVMKLLAVVNSAWTEIAERSRVEAQKPAAETSAAMSGKPGMDSPRSLEIMG
jgi:flagellar protein FliS